MTMSTRAQRTGWLLLAILLVPAHSDAIQLPSANPGSVFDYIDTPAFADGAKEFYRKSVASNQKRTSMIASAKEECGGRYEGTSLRVIELSHSIEADKRQAIGNAKDYVVPYDAKADVRWLALETISCSVHGGHDQAVLHASLLGGTETQIITYHFVNDRESGSPAVTDVRRVYKIEADLLAGQYRVPYSEQ